MKQIKKIRERILSTFLAIFLLVSMVFTYMPAVYAEGESPTEGTYSISLEGNDTANLCELRVYGYTGETKNSEPESDITNLTSGKYYVEVKKKENANINISSVKNGNDELSYSESTATYSGDVEITDNNLSILVEYKNYYKVTINWNSENGEVTVDDTDHDEQTTGKLVQTVMEDGTLRISAKPNTGYQLTSFTVNDESVMNDLVDNAESGTMDYTVLNLDEDVSVNVTFAIMSYSVSVPSTVAHGTVSASSLSVEYNQNVDITLKADDGYNLKSVSINNEEKLEGDLATMNPKENNDGSVTFTISNVTENQDIQASFVEQTEVEIDNRISITYSGTQKIYADTTKFFGTNSITIASINGNNLEIKDTKDSVKKGFNSVTYENSISINSIKVKTNSWFGRYEKVKLPTNTIQFIIDKTAPSITIPNVSGKVYSSGAEISGVSVSDTDSGIAKVTYTILDNETVVQDAKTVYSYNYDINNPVESMKSVSDSNFQNKIKLPSISDEVDKNYTIRVVAEDCVGKTQTEDVDIHVDTKKPVVSVDFDQDSAVNANYYNAARTAKITVEEANFDENLAREAVLASITPSNMYTCSEWSPVLNATDKYEMTVTFDQNAYYAMNLNIEDKVGNVNASVTDVENQNPKGFYVDKENPTATIKVKSDSREDNSYFTEITNDEVTKIQYGFMSNSTVSVKASPTDDSCPTNMIKVYSYVANDTDYSTDDKNALTLTQVKALDESVWKDSSVTIRNDNAAVVYYKVVDLAGNVSYFRTNGILVDKTLTDISAPVIKTNLKNGISKSSIKATVTVEDPKVNDVYSGIKTINYMIKNNDTGVTETKTINVTSDGEAVGLNKISTKKKKTFDININSDKFNSNNISLYVSVEDNAGNAIMNREIGKGKIKIDTTAPIVDISYDNNSSVNGTYFKANRIATIIVTERNFDEAAITTAITNEHGSVPIISKWTTIAGTMENGDDTKHVATLLFNEDGDYTVAVNMSADKAANVPSKIGFVDGTVDGAQFTIDKTQPAISVDYSNNAVIGDEYFDAGRTATITVKEHDFDANKVSIQTTGVCGGASIVTPQINWTHNGDIHTATLAYNTDGAYTLEAHATDLADNGDSGTSSSGVANNKFVVDTKLDAPIISGVEDGKSYQDKCIPSISINDENYDSYKVILTRTNKSKVSEDITSEFITGLSETATGAAGTFDTIEKTEDNDGIYLLSVTAIDKAGHSAITETRFTVNRFGSVYEYDDYLTDLIKDGGTYVKSVDKDLVITEYNPNPIAADTVKVDITCDGKPIEDVDFNISSRQSTNTNGWYAYQYTIAKSNFKKDGVYKMAVSSEDASGNTPQTDDFDDMGILFHVDATTPEITSITGLEDPIVSADSLKVNYVLFDNIALDKVTVYVDGKVIQEEKQFDDLNNYNGKFEINGANKSQSVRLVVIDKAGNVTDTDAEGYKSAFDFNNKVTVTSNALYRFFANKGAVAGTSGGVAVFGGGSAYLIFKKRKIV